MTSAKKFLRAEKILARRTKPYDDLFLTSLGMAERMLFTHAPHRSVISEEHQKAMH